MTLRGIIFDMDGTLIDSQLDFDAIRADLGMTNGEPILEEIEKLPEGDQKAKCHQILRRHERLGVERATMMPGATEFLEELFRQNMLTGILTRNSRISTLETLERLELNFSEVRTRNDVPPKPDPTGLLEICDAWNVSCDEVLFFGDFLFDLQAGQNAGMRTVLYAPGELPDYAHEADFTIEHFAEAGPLITRLAKPS